MISYVYLPTSLFVFFAKKTPKSFDFIRNYPTFVLRPCILKWGNTSRFIPALFLPNPLEKPFRNLLKIKPKISDQRINSFHGDN
ncbi:hypothetical protein EZS27_021556 [termite gut metagenome]|uniref:Uncharacterized protein n=1 Tax=termite gut metagenome TaxID=433724 RepID=A0A5J4R6N7_9ZZZZ